MPREDVGRPWPLISDHKALGKPEVKAKAESSSCIQSVLQLHTWRAPLQIPRGLWVLFTGWPLGRPSRDSCGPEWQKVQIRQNSSRKATKQRQQSLIKPGGMEGGGDWISRLAILFQIFSFQLKKMRCAKKWGSMTYNFKKSSQQNNLEEVQELNLLYKAFQL